MTSDRTPPHDAELEQAVLSAIVQSPATFDEVLEVLCSEEAFYDQRNQVVFSAIRKLQLSSLPCDIHSISSEIQKEGKLELAGGWGYLSTLEQFHISPVNAPIHAQKIRKLWVARQLGITGESMIRESFNLTQDPDDTRSHFERLLFRMGEFGISSKPKQSDQVFDEVVERCEAYSKKLKVGLETGLIDIDNALGGLRPGELIILAGRPGMGKSKLAGNIVVRLAQEGHPCYLFNLEMSNAEVAERYACSEAGVNHFSLRNGRAGKENELKVGDAAVHLRSLPILWHDNPFLKPSQLLSSLRREKRRNGIQFAVIDHMLLMGNDEQHRTQNDRVGEISRMLKLIAKEVNIPILALCQMNRAIDARTDGTPRLSDLRDSGNIEQDADTVLFLHKPKNAEANTAVLSIAKQRNGPTAEITLLDRANCYRFENYASGYCT